MRCPSCGTENAPDSRFCGNCGARMQQSSVAPTQKISDDAPFRPSGPQVVQSRVPTPQPFPGEAPRAISTPPGNYAYGNSIPPQNHSIPPQNVATPQHVSIPPRAQSVPPLASPTGPTPVRAPSNAAAGSQPPRPNTQARARSPVAESMTLPPRTRWGLVIAVLVLDLGLAGAGAWLLKEGLAKPEAKSGATPTEKSSLSDGVPGPSPRPVQNTKDTKIGATVQPSAGSGTGATEKPAPIGASSGSATTVPTTSPASSASAAATAQVPAAPAAPASNELAAAAKAPGAQPSLAAVTSPAPPVAVEANTAPKKRRKPAKKSVAPLDPYAPAPQ